MCNTVKDRFVVLKEIIRIFVSTATITYCSTTSLSTRRHYVNLYDILSALKDISDRKTDNIKSIILFT